MILWMLSGFALTAAAGNTWSFFAHRSAPWLWRVVRASRAVGAAAFGTGYILDALGILTTSERLTWNQPWGLATWPLVWILPAFIDHRTRTGFCVRHDRLMAELERRSAEESDDA